MHVDGAFGASALLSDSLREHLAGIENSDSLSWNAHKWMMQTYACSMALQTLGNDAMGSVLDHGCDMADLAESLIRKESGVGDQCSLQSWYRELPICRPW